MVGYLHSIFLRFPNAPSPPVMFLKTGMNSGINFLAIGPAGCLVDQQYGGVWAWCGNANGGPLRQKAYWSKRWMMVQHHSPTWCFSAWFGRVPQDDHLWKVEGTCPKNPSSGYYLSKRLGKLQKKRGQSPAQDASHHQDYCIMFLVGDPYKPSFPLLLGGGDNPMDKW